jgi:hypothetical protein
MCPDFNSRILTDTSHAGSAAASIKQPSPTSISGILSSIGQDHAHGGSLRRQPNSDRSHLPLGVTMLHDSLSFLDERGEPFRLMIANTRSTRERAYSLATRIYRRFGYVPHETKFMISRFDLIADTMTFLIEDRRGRDIATASLHFDSQAGLPCDEIFSDEINILRGKGRRLVEVTRLSVDERTQSRTVLTRLLEILGMSAWVGNATDCIAEVNPRHASLYETLMTFRQVGTQRPCPRVSGAPAVLLRLSDENYLREVRRCAGAGAVSDKKILMNTIYPDFFPAHHGLHIARKLREHNHPMSEADARYFGLAGFISDQAV